MQDNGLLEKFYLNTKSVPDTEQFKQDFSYRVFTNFVRPIASLTDKEDNARYYLKDCRDKLSVDAEVLLSQVYHKAGFQTAIYLPVSGGIAVPKGNLKYNIHRGALQIFSPTKSGQSVISNDIEEDRTIFYSDYPFQVLGKWGFSPIFPERAIGEKFIFKDYFTKDGARDFIKMHLFDVATQNFDRADGNFFINVDSDNKICGVKLFDYGASAWNDHFMPYENFLGFDKYSKQREDMLKQLSTNETVLEAMSKDDMCEALSEVSYAESAKDIEDKIGYKIEPELIKKFEDSTAEVLQALEG